MGPLSTTECTYLPTYLVREDALGGVLILLPVVVGVEGLCGELKGNGTGMGIRFPLEQLSVIPFHCFVVPHLVHIHILPGFLQYDSRYVP